MYLFIHPNGTTQSTIPPNADEQQLVRDNKLRVFCVESGRFQEMTFVNGRFDWLTVSLLVPYLKFDGDFSMRET